jgi:hypothetical protein
MVLQSLKKLIYCVNFKMYPKNIQMLKKRSSNFANINMSVLTIEKQKNISKLNIKNEKHSDHFGRCVGNMRNC